MSASKLYGPLFITSGAIKPTVPQAVLAISELFFANPKSPILHIYPLTSLLDRNIFSHFMSLWIIFFRWIADTPDIICSKIFSASFRLIFFVAFFAWNWINVPRSQYSITMKCHPDSQYKTLNTYEGIDISDHIRMINSTHGLDFFCNIPF